MSRHQPNQSINLVQHHYNTRQENIVTWARTQGTKQAVFYKFKFWFISCLCHRFWKDSQKFCELKLRWQKQKFTARNEMIDYKESGVDWQLHFDFICSPRTSFFFDKNVTLPYEFFLSYLKNNSFWPSDTIWQQRIGSTLARVMAWCLTALSHYLSQWGYCFVSLFIYSKEKHLPP